MNRLYEDTCWMVGTTFAWVTGCMTTATNCIRNLMAYANAADPLICVISGFGFLKEVAKECGSVVNVADCTGL